MIYINFRQTGSTFFQFFCFLAFFLLLSNTIKAEEIYKSNLDSTNSIGFSISADDKTKSEGVASIKTITEGPVTICLKRVKNLSIDNKTLVYKAKVKSEKLTGTAFLEMWCKIKGKNYFSRGMNDAVTESTDWKTIQTRFFLKKLLM